MVTTGNPFTRRYTDKYYCVLLFRVPLRCFVSQELDFCTTVNSNSVRQYSTSLNKKPKQSKLNGTMLIQVMYLFRCKYISAIYSYCWIFFSTCSLTAKLTVCYGCSFHDRVDYCGVILFYHCYPYCKIVTRANQNPQKAELYVCGIPTRGKHGCKLNVGYYLFALIFLIFDVELVFLYPWAVVAKKIGMIALVEVIIFSLSCSSVSHTLQKGRWSGCRMDAGSLIPDNQCTNNFWSFTLRPFVLSNQISWAINKIQQLNFPAGARNTRRRHCAEQARWYYQLGTPNSLWPPHFCYQLLWYRNDGNNFSQIWFFLFWIWIGRPLHDKPM